MQVVNGVEIIKF